MNIRTAAGALALAAALTLTGCAGSPDSAGDGSMSPAEATPPETPKPIVAAEPEFNDVDAQFLFELRKRTDQLTIVEASDEGLVAAGHAACDALAVDPDLNALRLVEGEQPLDDGRYFVSVVIGTHATKYLCPEFAAR